MKNDDSTQDRKTRVDGDRVIHTVKGSLYHGNNDERPRGLTTEQAENERVGWDIKERQIREAAHGEQQATEWGDPDATMPLPGRGRKNETDELTDPPFGKRGR
jgi:hypothetical protein